MDLAAICNASVHQAADVAIDSFRIRFRVRILALMFDEYESMPMKMEQNQVEFVSI